MFQNTRLFLLLLPCLLFSSCFQIIEEINMKNDGSGDMLLTINLSQSKTKVASIMLLDSVNGYKVPSRQDLQAKLNEAVAYLKKTEGLSNVKYTADFNNYIATISFSFKNISNLNRISNEILAKQKIKSASQSSYTFNKTTKLFSRNYFYVGQAKTSYNKLKEKDRAVFKSATYTSIYRFDQPIIKQSNPLATVSKTQKAILLKCSILSLINNSVNISNQIQLAP
jgi:hypothetical protein